MNINEVRKQTHRYFYEDGLVEIGIGSVFLLVNIVFILIPLIPGPLTAVAILLFPLLTFAGTYAVSKYIGKLKEQFVYPRTGYVAYNREDNRGRKLVIIGALALAILAVVLPDNLSSIALVQGTILAIVLTYLGTRTHLERFYVVAAVSLVCGIGLTLLGVSEINGAAGAFALTGAALIVSGVYGLLTYLRNNPAEDGHNQ